MPPQWSESQWSESQWSESWERWLRERERQPLELPEHRRAAVLVGLTAGVQPRILLTRRSAHLSHHQGQISFPGGRLEPGETPAEAALREAWEEVGLDPARVRLLGELDDQQTPSGYHVTPLLAVIPAQVAWILSEEVTEVLLPPWQDLQALQPERRRQPSGFETYHYLWQGHDIWGMTARVLHGLLKIEKRGL